MMVRISLASVALCLLMSPVALADSLVFNGGFETGDFSGWTVTGTQQYTGVLNNLSYAHSGKYAAWFGDEIPGLTYISQTLATIPGAQYDVSFWIRHDYGAPNAAEFWWGGSLIASATDADPFPYTQARWILTATLSSTELKIGAWDPPGGYIIDDVAVSAIPEPSSFMLLGTGLGGLALAAWRRKN